MARKNAIYKSPISKLFLELTGSRNLWQAWSDAITLIAISISNCFDYSHRAKERENRYKQIIENYSESEQKVIVKIFAEITDAINENPDQDLLGQLFMELELGNDHNGQFFTPYCVCKLMASIATDGKEEVKKEIDSKHFITANDCACGAGATLIAFANHLKDIGINYQSDCMFVAQDIDYTTALMCYIQLSLLGCPGYIKIGNTLTEPATTGAHQIEFSENIWLTPMMFSDLWQARRITWRMRELEETYDKAANM
jgi:type I restriction-modification system DNA methylase subunit